MGERSIYLFVDERIRREEKNARKRYYNIKRGNIISRNRPAKKRGGGGRVENVYKKRR